MPQRRISIPKERMFTGPASIWKRLLAFLIDLLIIDAVIAFPFRSILSKVMPADMSYQQSYDFLIKDASLAGLLTLVITVIGALAILYFSILEWKLSQTIGKMFMGIYVVSSLKKLSYWQALVRSIFLLPVFPFILLWIIDPIVLFFNKSNQRLTEILSKTKTIQSYAVQNY